MRNGLAKGAWTALVTPFKSNKEVDWEGFAKNIRFQIDQGIKGIVPTGTTGESPTLTPEEHGFAIKTAAAAASHKIGVLAGAGSNSTAEAMHYTSLAAEYGCDGVLLVDPYYNGPSSWEIALHYYMPIAQKYPNLAVVPYIIPGRTGCALLVEDLAMLAWEFQNIAAVKEATNDLERMRRTRMLAPLNFGIISGDDDKTAEMMRDQAIGAMGVISVISNIAPAAVQLMCQRFLDGDFQGGLLIEGVLCPLFKAVTVLCSREVQIPTAQPGNFYKGMVQDKFRNPLAIKTMMAGLGMPAGPCRPPLGRMTSQGVEMVRAALERTWILDSNVLKPIEEAYGVKIEDRLYNDEVWKELAGS